MIRARVALALLAVVAGCGPGRIVRRGQVNDDAVDVVRRELPAVRGLAFTRTVPVAAMPPEEIRQLLARDLDESYTPEELAMLQAVYLRLGLVPPDTDLRVALQHMYEEEGAGFYDPRSKRLVLATRALKSGGFWVGLLATLTGHDLVGDYLVSHELTHGLQDQHYGMPTTPEPITDSHGDRLLARHAVLEGDATLAGFAYLVRGPLDADTIDAITAKLAGLPEEISGRYPEVPELVRASVAVQYDEGTAFVGRALKTGGWAAVDDIYRDPPDSIEQVLHPERYFEVRDRPLEIALGGTDELERTGWRRAVEDTLGELDVRVLAERGFAPTDAARIADGWGGDRLRVLARASDLVLVWMTAWDSPLDAAEFADALRTVLPNAHTSQHDVRVLVLLGPDAPARVDLARLASRVWDRTRTSRAPA